MSVFLDVISFLSGVEYVSQAASKQCGLYLLALMSDMDAGEEQRALQTSGLLDCGTGLRLKAFRLFFYWCNQRCWSERQSLFSFVSCIVS